MATKKKKTKLRKRPRRPARGRTNASLMSLVLARATDACTTLLAEYAKERPRNVAEHIWETAILGATIGALTVVAERRPALARLKIDEAAAKVAARLRELA